MYLIGIHFFFFFFLLKLAAKWNQPPTFLSTCSDWRRIRNFKQVWDQILIGGCCCCKILLSRYLLKQGVGRVMCSSFLTWLSRPRKMSIMKNKQAQSGARGIMVTALGYAMNARPGPASWRWQTQERTRFIYVSLTRTAGLECQVTGASSNKVTVLTSAASCISKNKNLHHHWNKHFKAFPLSHGLNYSSCGE